MAHHLLRILHLVWYPCAIQMGRHGVQDCHMSISKNIQMITFDYMTAYDHTWLYMIIYYMTIYDYIWLYVHLCIATSKRIDKSVRDGIDDPFPYFPDFQLVYPFGPFYACISRLMLTICWATGASCFPTWPWDIMRQPLLDLKKGNMPPFKWFKHVKQISHWPTKSGCIPDMLTSLAWIM